MSAQRANELLRLADELPQSLRGWLIDGFGAWQQGQSLESALELQEDAPAMGLEERDDLLRVVIRTCPGETEAAQMLFFIDVLNGDREHPADTGRQFMRMLLRSRVYIPKTPRHLRRILAGRRFDGWRQRDMAAMVSSQAT